MMPPSTATPARFAAASELASGKRPIEKRRYPYVPILSMTAARSTDPAVGASVCASGSHVCTGNIGTLMTKASVNAAHSHICTCRGSMSRCSSK